MQDTFVTFHGWVGNDVRHRVVGETSIASFRVGVTPRIRKKEGEWVDGETAWYSVTTFRSLADNVRRSVRKGDPVVVHGRLRTETWTPEGGAPTTSLLVDASLVGHDLNRGSSHFWKERPMDGAGGDGETSVTRSADAGRAPVRGKQDETPAEGRADGEPGGSAAA